MTTDSANQISSPESFGEADGIELVDYVLGTTRSVRRRLDLKRPVPDQIIFDCLDLAEQAPTGGNQSTRRWLLIRDPATKKDLADIYRSAGGNWAIQQAASLAGTGHRSEATMDSAAHLAQHLEEVPVIVIATIWGTHDGSGKPSLFDSVIQSAWSFCLALRARGLGTAWTTMHLNAADQVAELLSIPTGVSQIVLLPVAYTDGTEFRLAERAPSREITYIDKWGNTREGRTDRHVTMADGPGVSVEVEIDAKPEQVWSLVSDIDLPARFSEEFMGAEWLDEPAVGASFQGRNQIAGFREWTTTSTVTAWRPGRRICLDDWRSGRSTECQLALSGLATGRLHPAQVQHGSRAGRVISHPSHRKEARTPGGDHFQSPGPASCQHEAHRRGHQDTRRIEVMNASPT